MGDATEIISKDRVPVTTPRAEQRAVKSVATATGSGSAAEAAQKARAPIGLRDVRSNDKVRAYIEKANEQMAVIGYSEHGLRHAALVAAIARNICLELDLEPRTAELASIAGYLHDIGNCIHRFTTRRSARRWLSSFWIRWA